MTVDRAWGLAKADRFGKADRFVSIKVMSSTRMYDPSTLL